MQTIYEPKGKAREYSPLALNIYSGCDHDCTYCYVKTMPHYKLGCVDNANPKPRPGLLGELKRYLARNTVTNQVLLSFTGDPYCAREILVNTTYSVLCTFIDHNVPTAILTKGGERCLRDLTLFRKFKTIKVGATLTFDNLQDSLSWEPGAATPESRLNALRRLHDEGITTWASFEPVVDPAQSLRLIEQTLPFIDQYKIGRWNHDVRSHAIDWRAFGTEAVRILRANNKAFYVKHDLQPHIDGLTANETDMNYLSLTTSGTHRAETEPTGQLTLI